MNDGNSARPRVNWHPADDAGGSTGPSGSGTGGPGFGFDLGDALAKLGLAAGEEPGAAGSGAAAPSPADAPQGWLGDRHPDEVPPLARRITSGEASPPADLPQRWLDDPRTDAAPPLARRATPPDSSPPADLPQRWLDDPRTDAAPPLATRTPAEPPPVALPTRGASAPTENLPRRGATGAPPPEQRAVEPEPMPQRAPVAPQPAPQPIAYTPDEGTPRPYVAPRRSVFDDVVSSSPSLPPTIVSAPGATSTPSVTMSAGQPIAAPATIHGTAQAPATQAAHAGTGTTGPAAPTVPGGQTAVFLPTLPAAPPAAPPPMAIASATAAAHVDPRSLRSAHVRARKQQRRSRLVGKTFLALLVIGGLFGAALAFGRPYLFPTEWDPSLTEIVDDVELERGGAFDHTVGLLEQNDAEFALTLARLAVGDEWVARVPEWRALGLAGGEPTLEVLADDVALGRVAVYDPATDRIYRAMSADPGAAARDLRIALELAYDTQLGIVPIPAEPLPGTLAGVSAATEIADRAVDGYLADLESPAAPAPTSTQPVPTTVPADVVPTSVPGAPVATTPPAAVPQAVPVPIQYQLLAEQQLVASAVAATGLDPNSAGFDVQLGSVLAKALDDVPAVAEAGPLQVGEVSLRDPVSLGVDDWSLVWASRLPSATVDQLVGLVVADSYRPIDRAGVTCVAGVFQSPSAEASAVVLSAMTAWVAAAPVESQAVASPLSDTRVQLVACDPGNTVAAPVTDAAMQLLARQMARVTG